LLETFRHTEETGRMALTAISLLCFAALLPFPGLGLPADSGESISVKLKTYILTLDVQL